MTHSLILMQQSNLTFPYYIAYKQPAPHKLLWSSFVSLLSFSLINELDNIFSMWLFYICMKVMF